MLKTSAKKRKSKFSSRLKAFSSFSDNFSTPSIRTGWKQNSGLWSLLSNKLITTSENAIISVPVSKSNATISINMPSGASGVGPLFWYDGINYWASYLEVSQSNGPSNCNNNACSGTESYTATRNCSCTTNYGTCQSSTYSIYGTCSQTTGTCSSSTTQSTTGSWNCSGCSSNGQQVVTGTSTTPRTYIGAAAKYTKSSAERTAGYNHCPYVSGPCRDEYSWSVYCGPGEELSSYSCYNPATTTTSYCTCNYSQTTTTTTTWNYPGCSSNGQTVVTGWNYSGCSSNGQQVYLGEGTSWNYSGCSSNGQQIVIGQSSTCNNGNCSGTESYTATRSCSCSTVTNRNIKTIKYENGVQTVIGTFSVSSNPTQIQIQTSGNNVTVSAGGNSATYTNLSSTKPKSFGILKTNGILEQGNSVSSFSVLAN